MAGCGYICPVCEGTGFTHEGEICDWCHQSPASAKTESTLSISPPNEESLEKPDNSLHLGTN